MPRIATLGSSSVSAFGDGFTNSNYTVTCYAWGGGGAAGTVGGWNYASNGGAGGVQHGSLQVRTGSPLLIAVGGAGATNQYNAGSNVGTYLGGSVASVNNSDNRYGGGSGGLSGIFAGGNTGSILTSVTYSTASTGTFTCTSTVNLSVNAQVRILGSNTSGSTIPFTPGVTYFVQSAPSTTTFTLSATSSGAVITGGVASTCTGLIFLITTPTTLQGTALLIAAGGGGGGSSNSAGTNTDLGGSGGYPNGAQGQDYYNSSYAGKAGTQSAAGATASSDGANTTAYQGALQGGNPTNNAYGGAGGGGWWGGSAGGYNSAYPDMAGGGGGSCWYHPTLVINPVTFANNGTSNVPNTTAITAGFSTIYSGIWTGTNYPGFGGTQNSNNASPGIVIISYPGTPKGSGGTIVQSSGTTYHVFVYTGANQYFYP
jgi:hypothetical protein